MRIFNKDNGTIHYSRDFKNECNLKSLFNWTNKKIKLHKTNQEEKREKKTLEKNG